VRANRKLKWIIRHHTEIVRIAADIFLKRKRRPGK
jgi:hypothetical protein